MAPTKDLCTDVIAQIVGLKSAGHTIKEIYSFTGAGPTSVKKYVRLWRQGSSTEAPRLTNIMGTERLFVTQFVCISKVGSPLPFFHIVLKFCLH